jgi:hypothetical protein
LDQENFDYQLFAQFLIKKKKDLPLTGAVNIPVVSFMPPPTFKNTFRKGIGVSGLVKLPYN